MHEDMQHQYGCFLLSPLFCVYFSLFDLSCKYNK